jgi:hypothetical protein
MPFLAIPLCRIGMRLGLDMRQQAVAAVQAKVLRLNSVAVADQTAGKVRFGAWVLANTADLV